ncbi:MAG: nitronate monooxygenase [Alphaproteobacteria bacterium TMED89]|nr:nitronate monooxygenase [Rhodospirillaceae bacterium]RPH16025.1 MAG: nitronate monooxygenase [Alphaproteobacteria bacterium TMED89]
MTGNLPVDLRESLKDFPVIGAPLFIISNPDLVIEQCKNGVVGSFPALNARPAEVLDEWLTRITEELAAHNAANPDKPAAPFAVNQICHPSNDRLEHDVEMCVKHKVPVVITSLNPPKAVVEAVHSYGGIIMHDIISVRHAEKALEQGVDGLICVAAGAGGHAGMLSPFALIKEIRSFFDGPVALSGAISYGGAVLSAQAMGADFAYIGTRFIATEEANADPDYKQMIVDSAAKDVIYTNLFTGVHGNYLSKSVVNAGLDPKDLPVADKSKMNFGSGGNTKAKAWKDIWGAGQGVGNISNAGPVASVIDEMKAEYQAAKARLL